MSKNIEKGAQKPPEEPLRQITIHGLITHYGTARAKLCASFLHKYLPHLYAKPEIHVYFDHDWIDFVNNMRDQLGDVHRRLWYLKYPIVIFFNDKYVGDHRTIIHYITTEHGIVPDLPYVDLFPDFTRFVPKRRNKDYVYLDLRVGDLNDYVIGKMVFELHTDIVPETCKFFKYICEPFGEYQFGQPKIKWKFSYLGSTIRRICGNSFIQGGSIPDSTLLRIKDENFTIKHNRRGVISIANQGGNRSTTEFVISLKPNPFMDGTNVAFGNLIFGEPLLAAIEKIPTYYQTPLKEIVVVGCGVIPSHDLWDTVDFQTAIMKEKQKIIEDIQEMKKKMEQIGDFKNRVQELLKESERQKSVEFIYTEEKFSDTDVLNDENWIKLWLRETCPQFQEEEEEEFYEENVGLEQEEDFEMGEEFRSDMEEEFKIFEESLGAKVFKGLTVEKYYIKRRRKDVAQKKKIMHELIRSVLEKMFEDISLEEPPILENIPVREIPDVPDVRDVPSELIQERYEAGLYSLPKSLIKSLIEVFDNLTPSQLKLLGLEARDILRKGGIPEKTLSICASEDIVSGIIMGVAQSELIKRGFFASQFDASGSMISIISKEELEELVEEISQDTVEAIKIHGPNLIENILVNKDSRPSLGEESATTIKHEQTEHPTTDDETFPMDPANISSIIEEALLE